MYEVILMLSNEVNCDYNPCFTFGSKDSAMQLVEVFTSQGYESLIRMQEGLDDEQ